MIEKALKYLLSLKRPEVIEHNGLKYSDTQLIQLPEDAPKIFQTKTLASIVDLIAKENNHQRLIDLIIHVESPTRVNVLTVLRENFERYNLYCATAELPSIILNNFIDLEQMNVMLKSTFVPTEDRDKLITLLGNVTEEGIKTTSDDGISQKVVARTGIATVGNVVVEPIVNLAPYRTFIEVEQPESEFLLRLQNGPEAALFEADGGAWRLEARKNIKAYFKDALEDLIERNKLIVTE